MSNSLFRTKKIESIIAEGSDDPHGGGSLKRVLTVRDLTFFGIAAILGAGSFSSLGGAVFNGGPGVVLLFVITAIACAFTALCYSEFASRIPVAGSAYTYAYASFGELFAWIIGWALIMEYSIGNIYVAFSWSDYFTSFLDKIGVHIPNWLSTSYMEAKGAMLSNGNPDDVAAWNTAPVIGGLRIIADIPALVINALITYLVYRGVKESRNFSNVMVILKLAVVILVILVGGYLVFSMGLTHNWTPPNDEGVRSFMPNGFGGVMAAVAGVFFAYIGFDAVSVMAEESRNPQRDLPRGMIYSLVICTIVYILLTLVLTGAVNYQNFDGVGDPLAFIFEEQNLDAGWMQLLVAVCAVIAMTSVLLVFQMGQPRIWMSMSRDGLLPPVFRKIHPVRKTPSFATIITGLVVGVPILFTDKTFVLDFTSIATLFAFVLVCGGVLLIPKKEKAAGKFNLPYINSRFVFPALVIGAIVILALVGKNYFSDIFEMNLNSQDQRKAVYSVIANTKSDFNDSYMLTPNELSIIKKRMNNDQQSGQLVNVIDHNNKLLNTMIDSVAYASITGGEAYKDVNRLSSSNENDSKTLIDSGRGSILQQLRLSSANYPPPALLDQNTIGSVTKGLSAAKDSGLMDKFNHQVYVYGLISNDSLVHADTNLVKTIDSKFAGLTRGDLKSEEGSILEAKRTLNVSTIIFWLICIVLAILALMKNWSLIPLLGLTTCLYLLTGMTKANWLWFGGWLLLGLIFYFLYGNRRSRLAQGNR
ncbi:MAG TPA: amino acid permease [Chitinophagaceae bacterium]|nr:amino acid permease [Chitinophagaceae bacterium]